MSDAGRPPYVVFETQAVEDRNASIEAGHFVARDVDYAIVTSPGSRDRIPMKLPDWFDSLRREPESRFPSAWLRQLEDAYKAWKAGHEAPTTGIAITSWAGVSPAQAKMLQGCDIRTVEDLAAATEEAIARFGMGGRALKQKAKDWLETAAGSGKLVEEVAALRAANEALTTRNESLEAQLASLSSRIDAVETKRTTPGMTKL